MRLHQHASDKKHARRVQWLAMASALLASASIACGADGFSSSGFRNAAPASSGLRPARVGAAGAESSGQASTSRKTTNKTARLAPPVKVDTSHVDLQRSSRRTAQQTPSGLTLRPAEPVPLDGPMASPLPSRRSSPSQSSLSDAYRKAKDDVVADSKRLVIREAEPLVPKSSSRRPGTSVPLVQQPALEVADQPEPMTAEYEEEVVAAPAQEEEHLAPIVSSAGLKRPTGLGVRREPDFVPPPTYTPPDVSVPPMPPKTSAVPSKRATTQVNANLESGHDEDSAQVSVASLQARRKYRGGPPASGSDDEPKQPALPQFASRDAYEADDTADSSASLARLEMPQVDRNPIQLRDATIEAHAAAKSPGMRLRPALSSAIPADQGSPTSDEFLSKLGVHVKKVEKKGPSSAKKTEGKLAADIEKASPASSGRILFLPPEPTPPKVGQPRLLEVPGAARALPAVESGNKAANTLSSRSTAQATWAKREKPAELLVKPAFAVGSPSTGESR